MATRRPRRPSLGTAPLLPGICLVIIIFWALAAVLMLTGTLINAREIDDTVVVINGEVQPIDKDLDSVKLAGETTKISGRIDRAAKPLSGQLTQVNSAAKDIDTSAKSILATAGTINRTVKTINGTARTINGTVKSINATATAINGNANAINGTVTAINGNVVSINGTVNSIGGKVESINGRVVSIGDKANSINSRVRSINSGVGPVNARSGGSINASVGSILRTVRPLSTTVDSIDMGRKGGGPDIFGVNNINRRAQDGIGAVGLVKADFDGILANVGFGIGPNGPDHGNGIHSHANSIDCAPLLNSGSTILVAGPLGGPLLTLLVPLVGPIVGPLLPILNNLAPTVRTQSCDT